MKTTITFIVFLFLITTSGYCAEQKTEVMKGLDGWYYSKVNVQSQAYSVDQKTQLCFISWNGNTLIPCSNLKKRSEWKDIITWE